jgi:hypothetical protein
LEFEAVDKWSFSSGSLTGGGFDVLNGMQTAFQRHNLITPFSLLKCNLTEVMDKIIATIECAFQWFQMW